MYSWLLVLVFLMARGGPGAKRRRSSAEQQEEQAAERSGSEYNPGDDSGDESQGEDWEGLQTTIQAQQAEIEKEKAKGKGKETEAEKSKKKKDKGKQKVTETEPAPEKRSSGRRKKTVGVTIGEPRSAAESPIRPPLPPVDSKRQRMYSSKQCVGERLVGIPNLVRRAPAFQALVDNGDLHEICKFSETTGYGLELIREFYMRAGNLVEAEGGPYMFTTSVRGVEMTISPDTVASVLEMVARTDGVDYLHSGLDAVKDWRRVFSALTIPEAENNGSQIYSKQLRMEYRYLNFLICYNIMPLTNTKVIRWDRVLYMYLIGHPDLVQAGNINLNIPFLLWKRMAREIKTSNRRDRLPYPLLIMRILRQHNVRVDCTYYEHSLGPIGDTTMVKSHVQLHGASPPRPDAPAPASPPAEESDDDASISSVFREQQRLSNDMERLTAAQEVFGAKQDKLISDVDRLNRRYGRVTRFLRLLCQKMGCGADEMPPPGSDSE